MTKKRKSIKSKKYNINSINPQNLEELNKNSINDLFTLNKFNNIKSYLWGFFFYEEKLKYSSLNKKTYLWTKEHFGLKHLRCFHKNIYENDEDIDEFSDSVDLNNNLERFFLEITRYIDKSNISYSELMRHLASYIHKKMFKTHLMLANIEQDSIMLSLLEYIPEISIFEDLQVISMYDIDLDSIIIEEIFTQYLMRPIYFNSLRKLAFVNVDLNDKCIGIINDFITKDLHSKKNLGSLTLSNNKIGQ